VLHLGQKQNAQTPHIHTAHNTTHTHHIHIHALHVGASAGLGSMRGDGDDGVALWWVYVMYIFMHKEKIKKNMQGWQLAAATYVCMYVYICTCNALTRKLGLGKLARAVYVLYTIGS